MLVLSRNLWSDEHGQGLTEYALIIAFVAVLLIGALIAFRGQLETVITNSGNAISTPH